MIKQRSGQFQRSLLLRLLVNDIDSLSIKWADTREELGSAFKLVYDEYERSGYITEHKPGSMFFYIHHLLPNTAVLLMLYKKRVISTLSLVADTKEFGLPMDSIYREELDELRKDDRKLLEACAFATSESFRWTNIFSYLFRQALWHAMHNGNTDICIMVNPKHVHFYRRILLFDDLGVEKIYPRVGAPAIALKLDTENYKGRLKSVYGDYPPECNLYSFVYKNQNLSPEARKLLFDMERHNGVGGKVTRYFYDALSPEQKSEFAQKIGHTENLKLLENALLRTG